MGDPLKRHKYAVNRILIPAARILSPEFNAAYLFLTGAHVELLRNLLDYANRETTFVDEYHEGYYYTPSDSDMNLINIIVAELEELLMGTVLGFYDAYVHVRDKKTLGGNGGTFTKDAWRTRDINEEVSDIDGLCSIASNQITLAPGTYRCLIIVPAWRVTSHQARLYNTDDTAVVLTGTSGHTTSTYGGIDQSIICGRFVLSAEKTLEVQHYCSMTQATYGFGVAGDFTDEIYTTAEFWREV